MPEPYYIQLAMPMLLCGLLTLINGITSIAESGVEFAYAWYTLVLLASLFIVMCVAVIYFMLRLRRYKEPDNVAVYVYAGLGVAAILCVVFIAIFPPTMYNCTCPDGTWGAPNCETCEGCEFGKCNSESGECACFEIGQDVTKECKECLPHWKPPECKECDDGFQEGCTECVVGRNILTNCTDCADGWVGENCDLCEAGWWGNPKVKCEQCGDCNGGTCVSNDHDKFDDNVCTPSGVVCSADADCSNSQNCAGKCVPTTRNPAQHLVQHYDEVVCRSDDDCGPTEELYLGKCVKKSCCEEPRFGDGTCENCPQGRRPPACEVCPGYVAGIDVVCNGHGTCQEGATCACEDGYSGEACEIYGDSCVEGFFRGASIHFEVCTPYPGVVNMNGLTACNGNAEALVNGSCVCRPEFEGNDCGECINGRFGMFCGHACEGLTYYDNGTVQKVCGQVWPDLAWCNNGTMGTGECYFLTT